MTEGDGELLGPERKVVLISGIYTVEKDPEGRYWLLLPDGRRDQGLSLADLALLARTLRRIARMEKEAKDRPPSP